jgi:hypothetical protein
MKCGNRYARDDSSIGMCSVFSLGTGWPPLRLVAPCRSGQGKSTERFLRRPGPIQKTRPAICMRSRLGFSDSRRRFPRRRLVLARSNVDRGCPCSLHGVSRCGTAVTIVVDEITREDKERYSIGDTPMRPTVRSEPLAESFAQDFFVMPKGRRGGHVFLVSCCDNGKRPWLCVVLSRASSSSTSLILDEFFHACSPDCTDAPSTARFGLIVRENGRVLDGVDSGSRFVATE